MLFFAAAESAFSLHPHTSHQITASLSSSPPSHFILRRSYIHFHSRMIRIAPVHSTHMALNNQQKPTQKLEPRHKKQEQHRNGIDDHVGTSTDTIANTSRRTLLKSIITALAILPSIHTTTINTQPANATYYPFGPKQRCSALYDDNCSSDGVTLGNSDKAIAANNAPADNTQESTATAASTSTSTSTSTSSPTATTTASKAYPVPKVATDITDYVRLDLSSVNGKPFGTLVVGLYGVSAPASAALFQALCAGTYEGGSRNYVRSQVFQVLKDDRINMGRLAKGMAIREEKFIDYSGYVRTKQLNAADKETNNDKNDIPHDQAGLISMKKGGGSFEFSIVSAPGPHPHMDQDGIVVGQVVQGMDVVAKLNALSTVKNTAYRDAFITAGNAIGDKRARAAADDVGKPLTKVIVSASGLVDTKIMSDSLLNH